MSILLGPSELFGLFRSFTQLSVEEAGPVPLSHWAGAAASLLSAAPQTLRKESSGLRGCRSLGTALPQPSSHPSAGAGGGWWVVVVYAALVGSRTKGHLPVSSRASA